MSFRLPPTFNMTTDQIRSIWDRMVTDGDVYFNPNEDKNNVRIWLVDQYLWRKGIKDFYIHPKENTTLENALRELQGLPWIPPKDPTFEAKCNEYKEAWENHKPNIVNTAKTYTIKE